MYRESGVSPRLRAETVALAPAQFLHQMQAHPQEEWFEQNSTVGFMLHEGGFVTDKGMGGYTHTKTVSIFATSAAGAWMLYTVVQGTGGATSDYYVGLVLLLIGIGVLAPLSTRQGASMIGAIFVGYIALSLTGEGPDDWKRFALSVFYLGAAAFVSAMCCAYLDRMRFADFL